jgi:hypothetical protein
MRICISSGHGAKVRGASCYIDEVTEARRVVEEVATQLRNVGVVVMTFHDNTSTTQQQNLETIVDWHNRQQRQLDVSVHFNAFNETMSPMGTECLYHPDGKMQASASEVAATIADAGGLKNRGAKPRTDLYFLNMTHEPAVLIEVCFVDSTVDVQCYKANFEDICFQLASITKPTDPEYQSPGKQLARFEGKMSWFGGPTDMGVSPDEGLAFIYDYDAAPHLFLNTQPPGTTGLARRLDPDVYYVACRWDYEKTPKEMLADKTKMAKVAAKDSGRWLLAWPADWGPHQDTGRAADLSLGLMDDLGLTTDDEVVVTYPHDPGRE